QAPLILLPLVHLIVKQAPLIRCLTAFKCRSQSKSNFPKPLLVFLWPHHTIASASASASATARPPPSMPKRGVLLLLKPLDVYPPIPAAQHLPNLAPSSSSPSPPFSALNPKFILSVTSFLLGALQIVSFLNDRLKVHKDTINLCQDVLRCKFVDWEPVICNNLCHPIRHVDLVITIGGDGTVLQASHFLDDSIPVNELSNEFDAARSTGYLCAASAQNFEQVMFRIPRSFCLAVQF
ncbi:hypothetical protein BHM03_00061599, partial [Ensete ventricosum]